MADHGFHRPTMEPDLTLSDEAFRDMLPLGAIPPPPQPSLPREKARPALTPKHPPPPPAPKMADQGFYRPIHQPRVDEILTDDRLARLDPSIILEPPSREERFQGQVEDLQRPDDPNRLNSASPRNLDETLEQLKTTGDDEVRSVLMEQLFNNLMGGKNPYKQFQKQLPSPFQKQFQNRIPPASGNTMQQNIQDEPWNQISQKREI